MISALGRAKRLPLAPEESRNAAFYEKHGFRVMEDGVAMQLCNFSNRS